MTIDEKIKQAARAAAPVFREMQWTWWNTEPYPPTQVQIENCFRKLLADVRENGSAYCSTGRLCVRYDVDFGHMFFVEVA